MVKKNVSYPAQRQRCIAAATVQAKKTMTSSQKKHFVASDPKSNNSFTQYSNGISGVNGLFGRALSAAFLSVVRQRTFVMDLVAPRSKKIKKSIPSPKLVLVEMLQVNSWKFS